MEFRPHFLELLSYSNRITIPGMEPMPQRGPTVLARLNAGTWNIFNHKYPKKLSRTFLNLRHSPPYEVYISDCVYVLKTTQFSNNLYATWCVCFAYKVNMTVCQFYPIREFLEKLHFFSPPQTLICISFRHCCEPLVSCILLRAPNHSESTRAVHFARRAQLKFRWKSESQSRARLNINLHSQHSRRIQSAAASAVGAQQQQHRLLGSRLCVCVPLGACGWLHS
jgi:hypothetical protein